MNLPNVFVGDFLVSFETTQRLIPSRFPSAAWEVKNNLKASQLWVSSPSSDWKGFPVQEYENNTWKIHLLGEVRNPVQDLWYENVFPKNISELNGQFLILAYEKHTHRWHAWTDRFGTLHIYYSRRAFGTFFPSVAAFSTRKLDWLALAGFFGFGFFPQDRTYNEDVFIMPPASHCVFDEDGGLIQKQRYWQWEHTPDLNRSYDDTVAEFASVFNKVMTESLAIGRAAIPLSGGLDSRSSVAPIPSNSNNKYWSYSYGYSDDSVETNIAHQVANARQLPFEAFTIQPYLFENIEKILAWTEGFQDITQPRQAFVRDEIAKHADVLIAALWGDVWLDDMGLAHHSENSLSTEQVTLHVLDKMKKNGRFWLFENLVQQQLAGEYPEAVLTDFIRNAMQPYEHIADADFRVKAFKTDNWSFRWSLAPIRIFQSAALPRLIFYDHRLTDFFQTVPSRFLTDRRLQIDYLKRYASDLARIPWQVYDANLYQYQWFNTWLLPKRAFKKIGRALRLKKVLERNWEVQFLSQQGRVGLESRLTKVDLNLHEFVSQKSVTTLLDAFYRSPNASQGYTISMLLTFSAWLENYG